MCYMLSFNETLVISNIKKPSLNTVSRAIQASTTITCPFNPVNKRIEPLVGEVCVLIHNVVTVVISLNISVNGNRVIFLNEIKIIDSFYNFA